MTFANIDQEAFKETLKSSYPGSVAEQEQPKQEGDFSLAGAGGNAVDQLQLMAYNALRAFSDGFDVDVLRTVADRGIEVNRKELAEYGRIGYDDIENLGDLNKWWLDNLIINAGSFVPIVAAGAAAAPFGGLAIAGATLIPSAILGTGESYAKQLEAEGNLNPTIALITGMTVGALDVFTPKKILNTFGIGKGFNSYLANKLASRGPISNRIHAALKGMFREGSTELLQETLMTMSKNYVNEQDLTDFTKEEINELIEATLSGGSVGGSISFALGEASPQDKALAAAKKNAGITLKDELEAEAARIQSEIDSLIDNEEFSTTNTSGRLANRGPNKLNKEGRKRKAELKKELKQVIKDKFAKDKAVLKAATLEDIDAIFPQEISEEETSAEASALDDQKTLAQIMAEDTRTSEFERVQQPDEVLTEGTERGATPTQEDINARLRTEAAERADRGTQDPSVLEDTMPMESGADLSVLLDQSPDQTGAGPQGRPRQPIADRANQGLENERPVVSQVVETDETLTAGDIYIRGEVDKAVQEKRFLLETSGPQRGRRKFYPDPESRARAEKKSNEERSKQEAEANLAAAKRIEDNKKFDKEQAAELKEEAIEMAGETFDAFMYGQISAEQFASRRQREMALIKDGIGGRAAANAYRKVAAIERVNAILKERGMPSLSLDKSTKPDQADVTPPKQEVPPKGGVGSSGGPTQADATPATPEAAPKPTQADATPPVPDTTETAPAAAEDAKAETATIPQGEEETPAQKAETTPDETPPVTADETKDSSDDATVKPTVKRARSAEEQRDSKSRDRSTASKAASGTSETKDATVTASRTIPNFEVDRPEDAEATGAVDTTTTGVDTVDPTIGVVTADAAAVDQTVADIDTDPIDSEASDPVRLEYEETTLNPDGVPMRIYEDPENPELNIVEVDGKPINQRYKNRARAESFANNYTRPRPTEKAAKAATKARPEGKTYAGPKPKGASESLVKWMGGTAPFRATIGKQRASQARKAGLDPNQYTTEEELYDAIVAQAEAQPVEAVEPAADVAKEVQQAAEEIVPETNLERISREATERRVKDNAIMVQEDLTPQEIAEMQELSNLSRTDNIRYNPRTNDYERVPDAEAESGLMEDIDAEVTAQIAAEEAESEAARATRKLEIESGKVSFETVDNMEAADFLQLAQTPRKPGWSKQQLVQIANNIQANDPTVSFDTKKKRADLAQELIAWKESGVTIDNSILEPEFKDDVTSDGDFYAAPSDDADATYGYDNKKSTLKDIKVSAEEISNIERSINNNLELMFSRGKAATLKRLKFINMISSSEANSLGIEGDSIASYASGDVKVYFVPERIAKFAKAQNKNVDKLTRSLIMHEVGVHAGKNIFSGQEFDLVLNQVVKLYDQKDPAFVNAFNVVAKAYPDLTLFERKFNEEVLAHVIESKAYEMETINKSFFDKLKTAFQKFFEKLFYTADSDKTRVDNLTPDVTAEDMFNLIAGHSMRNIYSYALKRHGDSKNLSNVRTRNRDRFIENSVVKKPMYHGAYYNFSAPVLDKTELGLHVGTERAAIARVGGEDYMIKEGYINIKNPFEIYDIERFNEHRLWRKAVNRLYENGDIDNNVYKSLSKVIEDHNFRFETWEASLGSRDILTLEEVFESNLRKEAIDKDFSKNMRDALLSLGYDSIAYENKVEDKGSTSYVLLKDNQFKDVDSLMFRSGTNVFMDKKVVEQSPEQAVVQSKKIADIAGPQVTNTRKAQGKVFGALKSMQRAIEPLMTVQGYNELETARMLAKGEVSKAHNTGRILFDTLYQTNKKEQQEILKYFETKNASPDNLPIRKVSVAMQPTVARGTRPEARTAKQVSIKDAVIQAKKQIEKLGQDLVDMGMITNDQYQELKGQYLPRTYLRYLAEDRLGIGLGTSKLNYTKARTSTDTFLKDILDGKIKDPGFLAGRYISMAGADIATIKYLDFIATDPGSNGWVLPNQIVNFEGMKGTVGFWNERLDGIRRNASQMELLNPEQAKSMNAMANKLQKAIEAVPEVIPPSKGYKRIPNSARYGAMKGLYVKKEIANDIMSQESLYTNNEVLNGVLSWSSRATKVFKYSKVPMNIPTQARNVISNVVLMDTSGTNFFKIPGLLNRAIQDIVSNGKYMELARKYGIESTTFASEELVTMDKELQKIKSKDKGWGGLWARTQVFFNDYLDVGGRAYQKTEVMFKVAKMIDLMENHGKSESEAARLANEALLDYSNVSQGVRVIRSLPLGSPFITFNLKAGAQMIRNIRNHPIAVAKYAAIPYVVSQMLLDNNDDIEEEDIPAMQKLVADYMEGNLTTMILPWKDDQGRLRVFDMGYFLPWGAHLSMAKNLMEGEFGEAAKTPGFFGGPFELVAGMKTNVDPFTGQEIWNESDPPLQKYQDMLGFLASYATPPMLWPRNKSGDVIGNGGQLWKTMMAANFIDGNIDQDGLPKNNMPRVLMSWMGINTTPLTSKTASRKVYYKGKELDRIKNRLLDLIDDPNVTEEDRNRLIEEYRMHSANTLEDYKGYAEAYGKVRDVLE